MLPTEQPVPGTGQQPFSQVAPTGVQAPVQQPQQMQQVPQQMQQLPPPQQLPLPQQLPPPQQLPLQQHFARPAPQPFNSRRPVFAPGQQYDVFEDFHSFDRIPLIHPKSYIPRNGGGPSLNGVPQPKDMFRSAVRYISPAVYHPDEPSKNVSQNVISVELGALYRNVELATGDPIRCKECKAVFCATDAPCLTKVKKDEDGGDDESNEREWTCRYCGCKQVIEIDDAEVPTSNVSEYMMVPAAKAPTDDAAAVEDDCYVVFCVDVSGSMSITSMKDGRYVSKLACVAEAVYSQLDALRHEHPNRRVCLITFGNDLDVFNGVEHKTASGLTLSDWDSTVRFAEDIKIDNPVSAVFDAIAEEVIYMKERGATALGPALLTAISIAGRKRGSYVVLCTDGMANQGIGSLEDLVVNEGDTKKSDVELLYERFGNTAKEAGVTVSIIGIKGTKCCMENLGVVADATGGNVSLADPQNIDMSGAVEEPVLATGVSLVVRVEPAFVFENGTSSVSSDLGNVKRFSQQQCALFSSPDDTKKPPSEVHMQCEITYTTNTGAVHLRVIEKVTPFVENIRQAVDGMDVHLFGNYVSRTAASMAHNGDVEAAGLFSQGYQDQLNNYMCMQSMASGEQVRMMNAFGAQNRRAQRMVDASTCQQRSMGMSNFSAARNRDDETSTNIYQMRSDAGAQDCLIM